jgi:hypothetical protein
VIAQSDQHFDVVALEYSIAGLICSVTCGLEAVMVGWPGAA